MRVPRRAHALALLWPLTLGATEWRLEPGVNLRTEFDDNPRLVSGAADAAYGVILRPSARLLAREALWEAGARATLQGRRYWGQDGLDTNDAYLDLDLLRRWERGRLDLAAGFSNDTSIRIDGIDFDTGISLAQIDRKTRDASLSYRYSLSERSSLSLAYVFTRVDYGNDPGQNLTDYRYLAPSLTFNHQLTPRSAWYGVLGYSRFDTPTVTVGDSLFSNTSARRSETYELRGGYRHLFTERLQTDLSLGARRTRSEVTSSGRIFGVAIPEQRSRDSSTGFVASAEVSYRFEVDRVQLNFNKSITPTSVGSEVDRSELGLSWEHRLGERLNAVLDLRLQNNQTINNGNTLADRDLLLINPQLRWDLARETRLSLGYRYRRVDRNNSADSHAAFAVLDHRFDPITLGR